MIKRIPREKIEDKLWNGCVHYALGGLPYAYTWYLDQVAEEWYGLVFNNYQAVMPVVHSRKFGVDYLYQPFFTQQLGIFAMEAMDSALQKAFLAAIPEKYKYIDIQVNAKTKVDEPGFEWIERPNYELSLFKPYEVLEDAYSGNLKRNLKKARKAELRFTNSLKVETYADFYVQHTASKVSGWQEKHKHMLHRLAYHCQHYNSGAVYGVYQGEELLSADLVLFFPKRIINLGPASSPAGRDCGAMAFLLDTLIRMNENKQMKLDFEGSDIESIARFYEGFGAQNKPYWRIRKNNLPWYLKPFKR